MIDPIEGALRRIDHSRFLAADLAFPEVVQANIGHDPVKPGMETTVKAKCMQVLVNPKESLLVDIPGILWRSQKVEGDPYNILIVCTDQRFERLCIPALR